MLLKEKEGDHMKKNTTIRIATGMMAACLLCGNAYALAACSNETQQVKKLCAAPPK